LLLYLLNLGVSLLGAPAFAAGGRLRGSAGSSSSGSLATAA
jgi:hypothetical protein